MIESNTIYHGEHFMGFEGSGLTFSDNAFTQCSFKKCRFSRAYFENCHFDQCNFEDCDLSLLSYDESNFHKIVIKRSKAAGISWAEALPPFAIDFEESEISYSSFYGKVLKKAKFIHCTAEEVDFSECQLTNSDFKGTDLKGAQFYNSSLDLCNFEGASNYSIDIRHTTIQGAKFSLPEAYSFFDILGIEVVNLDSF